MRVILAIFAGLCCYFIKRGDGTLTSSLFHTWGTYTVGTALLAISEIVLTGAVLPAIWIDYVLFLLTVLVSAGVEHIHSMDLTK